MAIHIDKKKIRKEIIENPSWIKKHKKWTIATAIIGAILGWEYTARAFTDSWNPIRQVQTINQVCKYGKLELGLEGFRWIPDIESRFYAETNRTYYDSFDGEFYKDHNTGKFCYIPRAEK